MMDQERDNEMYMGGGSDNTAQENNTLAQQPETGYTAAAAEETAAGSTDSSTSYSNTSYGSAGNSNSYGSSTSYGSTDSTSYSSASYGNTGTDSTYGSTDNSASNSAQSYDWTQPQYQNQNAQQNSRYAAYEFTQPSQGADVSRKKKQKKAKQRKKSGGFGRVMKGAVACICGGLILGVSAYGGITLMNHVVGPAVIKEEHVQTPTISTTTTGGASVGTQTTSTASSGNVVYDVSAVTKEVMPSVVSIVNSGTTQISTFWGPQEQEFTSSGSGVIVGTNDTELLIATNNHVIADAKSLEITFADDTTAEAVVKGKSNDMDLAVVAVKLEDLKQSTLDGIKIATLGDSDSLQVGEPAIAIGNALGYGQSVTSGIISALDREVTVETDSTYGFGNSQEITSKLIQTDAAINPGNSGGPLFNIKGEVIGINSVKYASSEVEGMGYAIPISEAQPILDDLMSRETKTKVDASKSAYLGIKGADVTEQAQSIYGMPSGGYVVSVENKSAAEKAGIKKGDIIVKLGDADVDSMDSLQEELQYYEAGETADIVVARSEAGEYKETTLQITFDKHPDADELEETEEDFDEKDDRED